MNISQALKEKSRIIRDVSRERDRLFKWNISIDGTTVPYDALECYENWLKLKEDLIQLKSKIQKANTGIMDKIFRLSELKDTIEHLKKLKCIEGELVTENYSNTTIERSRISILDRDQTVQEIEKEIDKIQNEIELYNHITLI
jgi:predicted ribosome quality control (RQC) complex YloA/Tae2 family protein